MGKQKATSPPGPVTPAPLSALLINAVEKDLLLGAYAAVVDEHGWTVVNGAEQLPGAITWESEPHRGPFYAAGPRAEFEQRWRAAGACVVSFISNEKILETVRAWVLSGKHLKVKESIDRAIVRLGGVEQLAMNLGLPWFDFDMFVTERDALRAVVSAAIDHETRAARTRLETGEAKPFEVSFALHAVSELALQAVVKLFENDGWKVSFETTTTRGAVKKTTRTWRMTRA